MNGLYARYPSGTDRVTSRIVGLLADLDERERETAYASVWTRSVNDQLVLVLSTL